MERLATVAVVVTLVVAHGALAASAPAAGEKDEPPPPPEPRIEFVDGRLSVDATDVPMMDLLERIGEVTGAQIVGTLTDPESVTVAFEDAPMRQAIDRIVGQRSFTLRYGGDGSLRRITLRGRSHEVPETTRRTRSPRADLQHAWARHPKVSLSGRLKQALRADSISLPQLLRSVRRLDDAGLRRQAIVRFMVEIDSDKALRRAWRGMQPDDLARFVKLNTGDRARETLAYVAVATKDPTTRRHAGTAMRLLPKTHVGGSR